MSPILPLVEHFRRRTLEPEDAAGERGITLFHVISLLAAPGVLLPFVLLVKSLRVSFFNFQRGVLASIAEADRLFFVIVAMTVMGLVTLATWDALFPDRKDYLSLLPLPLRARDVFLAKLIALAQLLAAFFLAANGISGVLAPLLWVDHAGASWLLRPILAFLLAMLAASAFVFFTLAGLQGLLQALLPPRFFRRASAALQATALTGLLALFFLRATTEQMWKDACAHLSDAGAGLPPLWFASLHEVLLGRHGNPFDAWAPRALVALAASAALFATAYALSYRRFVSGTLDSPVPPERSGRRGVVLDFFQRAFREPAAAGMFRFTLRTLSRGTHHRLVLSAGVALALALSLSAGVAFRTPGSFPDVEHLSVPLLQCFCLMAALRLALRRPVDLPASWVVRTAPIAAGTHLSDGARAAAFLVAVVPPAALACVGSLLFFGVKIALLQLLFNGVAGLLLVDFMIGRLPRVPLLSPRIAGEERLHMTAFPWVVAFVGFSEGGAALARALLGHPALLLGAAFVILASRLVVRRWGLVAAPRFEGTPDTIPELGLRPHA